MEIGSAALNILVECWDGHLTPPEVASLADRASRARDSNMVRSAAELALSCLPHAHALNPNEIQRALVQCKEQVSKSGVFDPLQHLANTGIGLAFFWHCGIGLKHGLLRFLNKHINSYVVERRSPVFQFFRAASLESEIMTI